MQQTKLPLLSMLSSKPLWVDDGVSGRNESTQKTDYRLFSTTNGRKLKAQSSRPKVWALISRVPLDHTYEDPLLPTQPVIDDWTQNRRYWRRRDEIDIPRVPFERHSNYRREYTEKMGDRVVIERPRHEATLSTEPFTAVSAYKSDYPPHNFAGSSSQTAMERHLVPQRADTICQCFTWVEKPASRPYPTKDPTSSDCAGENQHFAETSLRRWRPPTQPFARETTYSTQFVSHTQSVTPRRPIKPEEKVVHSAAPFDSQSDYRENFNKKPFPPQDKPVLQNLESMGFRGGNSGWRYVPDPDKEGSHTGVLPFVEHNKTVFYGANNPQD